MYKFFKGLFIDGGSEFIRTKAMSEDAVYQHQPDAIIFRPSDIYGQQDRFFRYNIIIVTFDAALHIHRKFLPWYFRGLSHYLRSVIRNVKSLPYAGKGIWKQPVYVQDVARGIVEAVYSNKFDGSIIEAVGLVSLLIFICS